MYILHFFLEHQEFWFILRYDFLGFFHRWKGNGWINAEKISLKAKYVKIWNCCIIFFLSFSFYFCLFFVFFTVSFFFTRIPIRIPCLYMDSYIQPNAEMENSYLYGNYFGSFFLLLSFLFDRYIQIAGYIKDSQFYYNFDRIGNRLCLPLSFGKSNLNLDPSQLRIYTKSSRVSLKSFQGCN